MKITIAKNAGFCFGVRRAINIALYAAKKEKRLYMLGDIVHNEDVVRLVSSAGAKKIKKIKEAAGSSLLICAHGSAKRILKKITENKTKIIDATCPMVKEIHKIVAIMDKKGYKIIVIGDPMHDEVKGIIGQIENKAIVLKGINCINKKIPKRLTKAAVVVQSTQNLDKVLKIQEALKNKIIDLKFFNTICSPTRSKQKEIKLLPQKNDCVIIIGSKSSANTKRLYEIAKSLNRNSHWVASESDIKKEWFKGAESVGITAGASTPDNTIKTIRAHIKKIAS